MKLAMNTMKDRPCFHIGMDFLQTLTLVPHVQFLLKASQFGQLSTDTSSMSLMLSSTKNLSAKHLTLWFWTCSGCPRRNSTYFYWGLNAYFFCCSYIYPNWVRPIPSVPCLLRDQNPSCTHQPFSTSNPPSFSPSCTTNILFSCVPAENVSLREPRHRGKSEDL